MSTGLTGRPRPRTRPPLGLTIFPTTTAPSSAQTAREAPPPPQRVMSSLPSVTAVSPLLLIESSPVHPALVQSETRKKDHQRGQASITVSSSHEAPCPIPNISNIWQKHASTSTSAFFRETQKLKSFFFITVVFYNSMFGGGKLIT